MATFTDLKEGAIAVMAGCLAKEGVGGVSRYHGKVTLSLSLSPPELSRQLLILVP